MQCPYRRGPGQLLLNPWSLYFESVVTRVHVNTAEWLYQPSIRILNNWWDNIVHISDYNTVHCTACILTSASSILLSSSQQCLCYCIRCPLLHLMLAHCTHAETSILAITTPLDCRHSSRSLQNRFIFSRRWCTSSTSILIIKLCFPRARSLS